MYPDREAEDRDFVDVEDIEEALSSISDMAEADCRVEEGKDNQEAFFDYIRDLC